MQDPKEKPYISTREPKIIQELQPNKICKCGACEPGKPKLPNGMRRLKVYYKAGCTETIPVILLQGEWIYKLGFDIEDHVIVSEKKANYQSRNRIVILKGCRCIKCVGSLHKNWKGLRPELEDLIF